MKNPLVSICIPTYNGEKFLKEALNSIHLQSYKNIEVIISDDYSTDNTLHICENFKEQASFPVSIYSHKPSNIGANWDNSIKYANGEYIKFLFQDDILKHDCIEVMVDYLLRNNLEIIFSKREIIDEEGELSNSDFLIRFGDLQQGIGLFIDDLHIFRKKDLYRLGSIRKNKLQYNFLGEPVASMFSKKLYNEIGGFESPLKQFLDLEYWLKVLKKYPIGITSKQLIQFRIHSQQASVINYQNKVNEVKYIENLIYKNFYFYLSNSVKKQHIKSLIKKLFQ